MLSSYYEKSAWDQGCDVGMSAPTHFEPSASMPMTTAIMGEINERSSEDFFMSFNTECPVFMDGAFSGLEFGLKLREKGRL